MFPVFVPFRPFYVQNSLMRGLPQQVLQVVDLKEKFSLESVPDLKRFFSRIKLTLKVKMMRLPTSSSVFIALSPVTAPPKKTWLGRASLKKTSRRLYPAGTFSFCTQILQKMNHSPTDRQRPFKKQSALHFQRINILVTCPKKKIYSI